jgi:hypothetical protein
MTSEILIAQGVNAETGVTYERELTAEEIQELAEWAALPNPNTMIEAKAAARASALAKLAELGLTKEEVAAL